MNRHKFMETLKKNLELNNVDEIEDILGEYEEHFARKLADGFSEEEIARKLGDPAEIAAQYESSSCRPAERLANRIPLVIGIYFADIWIVMFFAVVYAWDLVLALFSLASGLAGICLIASPSLILSPSGITYIPYLPGALLGIALTALGVVSTVLTICCYMLGAKLSAAWLKWHKNTLAGRNNVPYSIFPLFESKTRHRLRKVMLIALAVFGMLFAAAFTALVLSAGSLEFWHEWGWFGYAG